MSSAPPTTARCPAADRLIQHLDLGVEVWRERVGIDVLDANVGEQYGAQQMQALEGSVMTQTIIQEQRKITMVEFQKAEESREKAERQRGIADRAYRESLGFEILPDRHRLQGHPFYA